MRLFAKIKNATISFISITKSRKTNPMSRQQLLNIFYICLSTAAAFAADAFFQEVKQLQVLASLSLFWRVAAGYVAATLAFLCLLLIGRIFVSAKPVRDLIAPEAQLEGVWVQRVSRPTRPRAVVLIRFNWLAYEWTYEGWSIPNSRNEEPPAEWKCSNFVCRSGKYYFDAEAKVRQADPRDPVRRANVVGVLTRRGTRRNDLLVGNAVDFELPRGEQVFEIIEMKRVAVDQESMERADNDSAYRYDLVFPPASAPQSI